MNDPIDIVIDDSDLTLMFHDDLAPCGKVFAVVVPAWQASWDPADAVPYATKACSDVAEATDWFLDASLNRPWATRH